MSIIRDVTIKSREYLDTDDILIFVGARQAGKTTILKQIQSELKNKGESCYFLDLEDVEYLSLLNQTPKNLFKIFSLDLNRKNYIFVDEVQYLDNPSNFLKFLFDEYACKIKLIVSGSSAFYLDRKFKDSLAGRKKIFNVYTLSFPEFLRFKEEDELAKKLPGDLSLEDKNKISSYYREFMIFGGYPKAVLSFIEKKKEVLKELAYSYIKKDIYDSNISRSDMFYKLLKILSKQNGELLNSFELAGTLGISKTAVENYLYVMQKSFHISLARPFFKNIRKEITKMPKLFFLDLGLRNFFAGSFESFDLRDDKGQLLENAVYRQLMENYDRTEIKFWRTVNQKEIDFVVDNKALEVKMNPKKIKKKDFDLFFANYPEKEILVASIDADAEQETLYPLINVWNI